MFKTFSFKMGGVFALALFLTIPTFGQTVVSCSGQSVSACVKYPLQTYQCVDGDAIAPSLYGTKLLFPSIAQTSAQFLIVKGKITFPEDYTFAPGSDIVFLDNASGFRVVQSSAVAPTLTLNSSYLHGCTKLWAGVEVAQSSTIIAKNCEFEDAKAAIILRNQSVFEITGNTFRKNVCGILGLSSNPGLNISLLLRSRAGISGNTFWGEHQLLESSIPSSIDPGINSNAPGTSTNYPYSGIWIERVTALTIGLLSDQPGSTLNAFINFGQNAEQGIRTQGIRSISSNLTIRNSIFRNFGTFDGFTGIEADAVSAINNNLTITSTIIFGVNNTAPIAPINTFTSCYFDVRARGTNLTVQDMTSSNAVQSVDASHATPDQAPISYDIKNNQINAFKFRGIALSVKKQAPVNISNNRISDSNNPVDQLSPRYAILLDGSANSGGSVVLRAVGIIKNNEIHSSSNFEQGVFWGIGLRQVSYVIVENNRIFDDLTSTNLANFQGIRVGQFPCDGLRLYSNTIIGGSTSYVNSSGIFIRESANCIVNCNETNNTNNGIWFQGLCDNTDLSKNRFNSHATGLNLDNTNTGLTTIGTQTKKENRWFGNSSTIEALAPNLASAQGSLFEINSSDLNSDYWPSPRKIGTVDDNMQWFVMLPGQEPSNDFTCLSGKVFGDRDLADTDRKILSGTYTAPMAYSALEWEARWRFADRLHRNPELSLNSPEISEYYQSTADESYNRLSQIYQSYLNRWDTGTAVESSISTQFAAIEQRFALDNLLSDLPASASLHNQMLDADASIEEKTIALESRLIDWATDVKQTMFNLSETLNSVTCNHAYEKDMQTVLGIMIESHFNAGVLTESQTKIMTEIAEKCRYSGGYAVVLARSCFETQETYNQDRDCLENKERAQNTSTNTSKQMTINISPNPAVETFTLTIEEPFQEAILQIFNSQGVLVQTQILSSPYTIIPVGTYPTGLYRVNVTANGRMPESKNFVKTR